MLTLSGVLTNTDTSVSAPPLLICTTQVKHLYSPPLRHVLTCCLLQLLRHG
jgi:hypothetical protein